MCNVSWVNPSLRCSVRAHLLRVGCQFLAQCIKNTPEHLFPAKSSRLAVGTMLSVDCSWCLLLCLLFISMCKYVWCGFLVEDFRRGALIMVCSPFFFTNSGIWPSATVSAQYLCVAWFVCSVARSVGHRHFNFVASQHFKHITKYVWCRSREMWLL